MRARLHRKIAKSCEPIRKFDDAALHYSTAENILGEPATDARPDWWHEAIQVGLDKVWLHYTRAQLPELEALAAKITNWIETHGSASQRARFNFVLTLCAHRRERYTVSDHTVELLLKLYRAATDTKQLSEMANASFALGFGYLWRHQFEDAENYLLEALTRSERTGDAILKSRVLTYLSVTYRRQDNIEKAREFSDKTLQLATEINMAEYMAVARANLAWLAYKEQKFFEAERQAFAAVAGWASIPLAFPFQHLALWPLAGIAAEKKDFSAVTHYLRSMIEPAQQQFPDELRISITNALKSNERGDSLMLSCLDLARKYKYL